MYRHLFDIVAYGYEGQLYCMEDSHDIMDMEESYPVFVANLDDIMDMGGMCCAVCHGDIE